MGACDCNDCWLWRYCSCVDFWEVVSCFTNACWYWHDRDVNECLDKLFVKDNPDDQIKLDKLQDELITQRILLEKQSEKIEELHKMIQDLLEKSNLDHTKTTRRVVFTIKQIL